MSKQDQANESTVSFIDQLTLSTESSELRLSDIHGLEDRLAKVRDGFIPAVATPNLAIRPASLLLYGPEGIGKSRIANAVAGELAEHDFRCTQLSTQRISAMRDGGHHKTKEQPVADLVEEASEVAPIVLILEDLENVYLDDGGPFHSTIDAIRDGDQRVAVICVLTTDNRRRFTPKRAPEHFEFADFTLHVPQPDGERKRHVLTHLLNRLLDGTNTTLAIETESLPVHNHEPETANLRAVARRAVTLAQTRSADSTVRTDDVADAIEQLSGDRAPTPGPRDKSDVPTFEQSPPEVTFDDIGGLESVIQRLRELVTYPNQYDKLYAESTLEPANGVLLHGPPGTGKTLLAQALANETERTFFAVEGAAIKSKWFGQSEKRIRTLFKTAREEAPSIVFFDEFDALAGSRDATSHSAVQSIVNTLLAEVDGVGESDDLLVMAATNRPEALDAAMTRPGRLGESLEVPPPDERGQKEIFRIHAKEIPTSEAVTPHWFATTVPNCVTGADIAAIVERAVHLAIRRADETAVTPEMWKVDLERAIECTAGSGPDKFRGYY
jgi:transitional endoplasmic reticulum ATPase